MIRSSRAHGRVVRRRAPGAAPLLAVLALGVAPALSGCSFANPSVVVSYPASDGVNGQIDDEATGTSLRLLNLVLVTADEGAPGAVIGAIANDGTDPVTVNFTVLDQSGQPVGDGTIRARPGVLTKIGDGGDDVRVASVPSPPGSTVRLQVDTPVGGAPLVLPVVAADGPYAGRAPSPTPSSSTPSPSATASPSPSVS